ncbi:hypothetical protein DL96DRAFT_1712277 [Flagelloscypha sp. PMI_526]|nr:hypothetical protein DL96DRAFT_1712277 [Flagelloscypha sp. PMI_526]
MRILSFAIAFSTLLCSIDGAPTPQLAGLTGGGAAAGAPVAGSGGAAPAPAPGGLPALPSVPGLDIMKTLGGLPALGGLAGGGEKGRRSELNESPTRRFIGNLAGAFLPVLKTVTGGLGGEGGNGTESSGVPLGTTSQLGVRSENLHRNRRMPGVGIPPAPFLHFMTTSNTARSEVGDNKKREKRFGRNNMALLMKHFLDDEDEEDEDEIDEDEDENDEEK